MSSAARAPTLTLQMAPLLEKMRSTDSDLRTMALLDLHKDLLRVTSSPAPAASASQSASARKAETSYTEEHVEKELTNAVLKTMADPISEVKNVSVSCIGAMVRRARPQFLNQIVNELLIYVNSSDKENEANEGVRDISCLALKAVVLEMPTDGAIAPQIVENIITKVYPVLTKANPNAQLASELLQILTDVYIRFSPIIAGSDALQGTSINSLIKIISSSRLPIRKRAIPALGALVSTNPKLFDGVKPKITEGLTAGGDTGKVWAAVVASLAKGQSAARIGGLISNDDIVTLILDQAEDPEDVETTEGALMALEVLVLRCPTEIGPTVGDITQKALELIKYDPNFVQLDDDEDVDMDVDMDADDEDDDDEDEDAYSDDEDVSWKVRRSAAKLIHALVGTRNELLAEFYRNASPVLVSRMDEREESVRLEILAAFAALLRQTATARHAELASGPRNKRKRSEEIEDDSGPEDSVTTALQMSLPQVLKAVLKQLNSKSLPTKQESFGILRQLAEVIGGGLESDSPSICTAAIAALRSVDTATTSSLAIAALSFLAAYFRNHPSRAYVKYLGDLVPAIIRCMKDKLQRISFEGFNAASALAQSIRPVGSASPIKADVTAPVKQLFSATAEVLADSTVDADVREKALETLGDILVHEGDVLTASYKQCLPLITARLTTESTANTAVIVIGKIAESPSCKGSVIDNWLLGILPDVITALRRSRRTTGKNAEFNCLSAILARIGAQLPPKTADSMIKELAPFLAQPTTIQTIALILARQPKARASVTSLIPQVLEVVKSPTSANASQVEGLTTFFTTYVAGDPDSATRLVPQLVDNLGRAPQIPDATKGGTGMYTTTARIIGAVVSASLRNAAGILALFQKTIKTGKATEADTYLSLLCIGEIGRITDLSADAKLFERVTSFFKTQSEEVRSAAAFAAGNLAVGSHTVFLPALVQQIGSEKNAASRLLLLHALKEVILHLPSARLELLADSLWKPLLAEDGAVSGDQAVGDDGIRNVKAACIGKLITTAPAKFLPQLQQLLRSGARNRAIVAAAVRYTFIDTSSSYDELISPLIVEFLSLMHDENLVVRRLSLASLNAAIQNKPHLVIDRLNTLQPLLYQETVVKPELQRSVQMGPFKIIEDDGLENRKTAYETMYTLLATCFNKIDLPTFTDRVMAALSDVNEIKVLGLMLLLRLGQLAPNSIIPRLDEVSEAVQSIMKDVEVKDDTIKQDLERKEEMQRSTLRTVVPLYKMSTAQQAPKFHAFVGQLLSQNQWREFREYQA